MLNSDALHRHSIFNKVFLMALGRGGGMARGSTAFQNMSCLYLTHYSNIIDLVHSDWSTSGQVGSSTRPHEYAATVDVLHTPLNHCADKWRHEEINYSLD